MKVTTLQALILLEFNESEVLFVSDLVNKMGPGNQMDLFRCAAEYLALRKVIIVERKEEVDGENGEDKWNVVKTDSDTAFIESDDRLKLNITLIQRYFQRLPYIPIPLCTLTTDFLKKKKNSRKSEDTWTMYGFQQFRQRIRNPVPSATESLQWAADSVIVRIMKNRRVLSQAQLIAETVTMLKSRPDLWRLPANSTVFIAKRIVSLIERDYLRRDEETKQLHYVL